MPGYGLQAPLPMVKLLAGYEIRFEALNSRGTGHVDGVVITNSTILVEGDSTDQDTSEGGPFMFVPGAEV